MTPGAAAGRCGIDTVEIARIERLLRETPDTDLARLFTATELADAGEGAGRAASLAARFAAKEACLKLFPRETALGAIEAFDFGVARDGYGAPRVSMTPRARAVLDRHRVATIALSLTHDAVSASAVALAEPATIEVPLAGRILHRLVPWRRDVVQQNLERVFGATLPPAEIERIKLAFYGHIWKLLVEFFTLPFLAHEKKLARVRVDNNAALDAALAQGRGALVMTGHFGNWEVASVAAIGHFPALKGRFHFVRRPIKPKWLDDLVNRRFERAGFGVFGKRASLDGMLDRLEAGDVIVFPFDQHARGSDGVRVDFFGEPAGTFRALALIALSTGAPVVPAAAWREPDGRHVVRFEEAIPVIECDDVDEAIRLNTRAYNEVLERLVLRHPEQWYWVHRRWKR
jgi:phosphopantetheine--protein transferase-like protein